MVGLTGVVYAVFAIIMGIGWSILGFTFFRLRDRKSARHVFLASLLYLPLLLGVMIADRNELPPVRPSILILQPAEDTPQPPAAPDPTPIPVTPAHGP
jgi:hypothetical protein